MSGNVQLYLEHLTYQLESMLREEQAVLMHEARKTQVEECSTGRVSRRGALRKTRRTDTKGNSFVVFPQAPPSLQPSIPINCPPRSFSPSPSGSSFPSVFLWSPRSSSASSASRDREAGGQGSPTSGSQRTKKGLASFLPSNLTGSRERLSRLSSKNSGNRSVSAWLGDENLSADHFRLATLIQDVGRAPQKFPAFCDFWFRTGAGGTESVRMATSASFVCTRLISL